MTAPCRWPHSRVLLALSIALLLPVAALSSCRSPDKMPSLKQLTICKYLILGGGPGGMFSAYLLRSLGSDLCVVEREAARKSGSKLLEFLDGSSPVKRQNSWGGRMAEYYNSMPNQKPADRKPFGSCGLRVAEGQRHMRCLVSELNITTQRSDFDDIFYTRGRWTRSIADQLGATFTFTNATGNAAGSLVDALFGFAFDWISNINPLTGQVAVTPQAELCKNFSTVHEYLVALLGPEPTAFMLAGNPFKGQWQIQLDVCMYLRLSQFEDGRAPNPKGADLPEWPLGNSGSEFYIHFSEFYQKIRDVAGAAGVRFFDGSEITSLFKVPRLPGFKSNTTFVATMKNGRGWAAERLISNTATESLQYIKGSLGCQLFNHPNVQAQVTNDVVIYNAFYPNRFWEKYQSTSNKALRVITDDYCMSRSEFAGHPWAREVNVTRPLYNDDPSCVEVWKTLYKQGGMPAVRGEIQRKLQAIMPGVEVPLPTADWFYAPKLFAHFLEPGSTVKGRNMMTIYKWAADPLGDKSMCLVGEAYAPHGVGWAAGVLTTAINCIQSNFLDVLSAEDAANVQYVSSGCGNATSFPNEEFPAYAPMPGQLPW